MLNLLTPDYSDDFIDFCKDDVIGAVLTTRLKAYGADCPFAMFWYSSDEKGNILSASGLFDGVFSFTANDNADIEEILTFAKIVGASNVLCCEKFLPSCGNIYNCMVFRGTATENVTAEDVTAENLKHMYDIIFEENNHVNFSQWYTDVSHKIRHSLIHGSCVSVDGKYVSVALTSGETENCAVISSVATLKEFRHNGFGKKAVQDLIRKTDKKMYLLTDNELSHSWYISIGFTDFSIFTELRQ